MRAFPHAPRGPLPAVILTVSLATAIAVVMGCSSTVISGTYECSGAVCACATELVAGYEHTCARKGDGTLWCWGLNGIGQLGDGTTTGTPSPVQVSALGTSVVEVAAGGESTCARKEDGTLWCWGGDGIIYSPNPSPVQVTALGTSVAEVAVGATHSCARKGDGTLWCWGDNTFGQVGDGTTVAKPSPAQVTALGTSVVEVAAGDFHTCARKGDGTLWCWGFNTKGQVGDGTTLDAHSPVQVTALGMSVVEATAGALHTCARKGDGTLWCWGNNDDGEMGDGTTDSPDSPNPSPVQVTALGAGVAQGEAGGWHSCARKADGTLWCWGSNGSGQVGDGTTDSPKPSPVQVTALGAGVVEITAGIGHTCARKADGTLWCWGLNAEGEVGDGTMVSPKLSPAQVLLTCP